MQKKTYYNKQVEFFVVILLTILAFFLRFYNYMNVSVVLDETGFSRYAYSILADSWGWPLEQMATNHPPLIPYQLAVLTYLFGGSLEIFRVLIIFYGSFTVIVVYYLSKELYNQRVGILSALLLTFYSYHIIYSKYVMLEVPLIFFIFSYLYFFWKSYNKPTDIRSAMISGVFLGLAISTKYIGFLLYFASILFILLDNLNKKSHLSFTSLLERRYIIIFLVSLLVFSPFLIQIIVNSVNPFFFQLFGRFKIGNPTYIQYPSLLGMIMSGFNQYISTIMDSNGLATKSLPWLFIFQLAAQFLFPVTIFYYALNIKKSNYSYLLVFYMVFNAFVFFYGTRHQNYQLWLFPAFLIMLSQLTIVSINSVKNNSIYINAYKSLLNRALLLFSFIFIISFIFIGATAPALNKDSEWKISGYEYATKYIINNINENDLVATDATIYLEYLITTNKYDLEKNNNILFNFYNIDKINGKIIVGVDTKVLEAIRPRFLVVKGFNYQFLATRQDQMNIRKYYDLVILKNDVYVFVLKSP